MEISKWIDNRKEMTHEDHDIFEELLKKDGSYIQFLLDGEVLLDRLALPQMLNSSIVKKFITITEHGTARMKRYSQELWEIHKHNDVFDARASEIPGPVTWDIQKFESVYQSMLYNKGLFGKAAYVENPTHNMYLNACLLFNKPNCFGYNYSTMFNKIETFMVYDLLDSDRKKVCEIHRSHVEELTEEELEFLFAFTSKQQKLC